ncbi:Vacuolar protein sorting-associated protein VTA1-like protein [Aphelenchoides bicaudatus]|nr:Vacuolar protein sorting-associated protein VTA1-like protein [Aphelenchoides bicaudatus]
MNLLDIPAEYRPISPYIKVAIQFSENDPVLYYWLLNYSVEKALAIKDSTPVSKQYLINLLDLLEKIKGQHSGDESYAVGAVAQCHVEAKALRLFTTADNQERQGVFNKNVIKLFYTSGLLFDILSMFTSEELEEKLQEARKYAKWKATELSNCLKNGTTPQPGPLSNKGEDDELTRELLNLDVTKPQPTPRTTSNAPAPSQFNQPANFPPPNQQHTGFNTPQQQFGGGQYQQPQQFNTGYNQPQQQFGQEYPPQQPHYPPSQHHHNVPSHPTQNSEVTLDEFIEARKLTKMANSALDYEDAKTAIDFLRKALKVLEK